MIQKIKTGGREEWLQFRHGYIGGADAGTVVGLNPYSSPYELWAEKTGKIPAFEGNIITTVGSYLEELVAKLFEEETGKKVKRSNFTYVNDKYPFACADVDRLVIGESALLEIKTTNSVPTMKKIRGGEFPEQWWCQVSHYMAVLDLPKAYLAVLVNCRELKIYELYRDDSEIDALMQAESEFWECVKNNTPPAIDGSDATTEAISTIWRDSDGGTIALVGRDPLLDEYLDLREQEKAVKERISAIENIIKEDMEESERAECGRFTVSWKSQQRSTFQPKAFSKAYPDVDLTPFYKTTTSRPFKVTVKEDT